MKKILTVGLFFLASTSVYSQVAIINGELKSFKNGTVYFVDGFNWSVPIDSAICVDGKFSLFIRNPKLNFPFLASIRYKQKNGKSKMMMFNVKSNIHHIERSTVFVCNPLRYKLQEIDFNKETNEIILNLPDDDQNRSYRNLILTNFLLRSNQPEQRESEFQQILATVQQYPYSYFAFFSIYRNRTFYKKNELSTLFYLFDLELRKSILGEEIQAYLNRLDCKNCKVPNILLTDKEGQKRVLTYEKPVTMVIFWASWCKPCREEIPVVKKIYQEYGNQIQIINLSVDTDKDAWRKALIQEQMPWLQAWIENKDAERVKSLFNFQVIPFTIFINKNGSEIARFYGVSGDIYPLYKELIQKQLLSNK